MAIIHDAWLFNPSRFAEAMAGYVRSLVENPSGGYQLLQDAAVATLDRCKSGWTYADRYGGWDRASVLAELAELQASDGRGHMGFCLMLFLYAHLAANNVTDESLGLRDLWRNSRGSLDRLDCTNGERELLIRGHSFHHFLERYIAPHLTARQVAEMAGVWECVHPASTGGHAGWLDDKDIEMLSRTLKDARAMLGSRTSSPLSSALDEAEVIRRAENMLQTARAKNRGLCLILSG